MRLKIAVVTALLACGPIAAFAAEPQHTGLPQHKVVSEDVNATRRVLTVRIDERLDEPDIGAIAEAVKARGRAHASRTQVNFHLPAGRLTDTPWATAVYAPDLKVTVNGLTLAEAHAYSSEVQNDRRAFVGAWLTDAPAVPGRLAIFREKGKVFAEWRTRGGRRSVDEVVERRGYRGRFDISGDDSQHYVVVPGGALELRAKTDVIAVAERISLGAERGKLAERGLGTASALAAKREQAAAALAAARARAQPATVQAAAQAVTVPVAPVRQQAPSARPPAADSVVVAAVAPQAAPAIAAATEPAETATAPVFRDKPGKAKRHATRHRQVIAARAAKQTSVIGAWFK